MGDSSVALRHLLDCLEASRLLLHGWLSFFTALVVIGVVSETIFVIWEYRNDRHDFRRGIIRPPDRPNRLKFALEMVGVGLVAIGVAGELSVEPWLAAVETKLENANAEHSAELQFELRTSIARSFHGDRAIDPFVFDNILRNRPRGHVEIWQTVDDPDAHGLSIQLWNVFRGAGWDALPMQRLPPETKALWNSLVVRCHPWDMTYPIGAKPPRTAVEALLKALQMGGIESGPASPIWETPDTALPDGHCVIEVHPQTPFERKINSAKK
ncbi:MAG: hypothetical protein WCF61_20250 [Terriglobales bacterium]